MKSIFLQRRVLSFIPRRLKYPQTGNILLRLALSFARRSTKKLLASSKLLTSFAGTAGVLTAVNLTVLNAASKITNMAEEVAKADALYKKNKFLEVYEYLVTLKDSEDPRILWRLVRATRDRANMVEVSKDDKKKMLFEGFEVAKRALQHGEDIAACHKWVGIMISQTGDYLGTKKKIEDSPAMKKHFQRASELDPTDPTPHYLLGMWCFSFADLAWYERKIAAVVFGSPPESTYQEALESFEKAENLSPLFYSANLLMLGTVNLKMGNKAKAKEWFEKLDNYDVVKDEDKETITRPKQVSKNE